MNPMIGVSWMNMKQAGYSISHIHPESFFNPASSCHRTLQQCCYGTSHSIEKAMCRCRTVPNADLITLHELAYPSCLSSAHFVIQGRFLIHFIWTLPPSLLQTEAVIFRPERQKKTAHIFDKQYPEENFIFIFHFPTDILAEITCTFNPCWSTRLAIWNEAKQWQHRVFVPHLVKSVTAIIPSPLVCQPYLPLMISSGQTAWTTRTQKWQKRKL